MVSGGLRAAFLSTLAKLEAGKNALNLHFTRDWLNAMLCGCALLVSQFIGVLSVIKKSYYPYFKFYYPIVYSCLSC